jgi:hypothetical protein
MVFQARNHVKPGLDSSRVKFPIVNSLNYGDLPSQVELAEPKWNLANDHLKTSYEKK